MWLLSIIARAVSSVIRWLVITIGQMDHVNGGERKSVSPTRKRVMNRAFWFLLVPLVHQPSSTRTDEEDVLLLALGTLSSCNSISEEESS